MERVLNAAPSRAIRPVRGLLLQAAVVALAGMLPLLPPERGPMLIVPLLPGSGEAVVWASQSGARLLRPGPFPGSYLVWAERPDLSGAALAHGALLLNAGLAGCSITTEPTTDKGSQ